MSSPLVQAATPCIQLASSDPRAWDEQWRKYFAVLHASASPTSPSVEELELLTLLILAKKDAAKQCDSEVRNTRALRKTLCEIQMELTRVAAPFSVEQELQQRWMSATPEKRGDLILAALVYTCSTNETLHQARRYCEKEMDVVSHRRDGQLLLDLVEEMMIQNPTATAPETPIYISHPVWDAMAAKHQGAGNRNEVILTSILAERNMLIAFVLWHTLRSFLDLPLPQIHHSTGTRKPKLRSNVSCPEEELLRVLHGDEAAKGIIKAGRQTARTDHIQRKEAYAKGKQVCHSCKTPNDTTATKYPRCKRCWDTIQREVFYCSSECQKIDWKAGHKKECGRLLQLEDLTTPAPVPLTPQIGPPLPGFKRSGPLIFQITQLNQLSPQYDYIIYMEGGRRGYVTFSHPTIGPAFRVCRDKAMTTGDRLVIAKLAHFLILLYRSEPRMQGIGVESYAMVEQLTLEFDFPVPEILRAVEEMEARMNFAHGGRRPPLILEAGISLAEWDALAITPAWVDFGIVPLPSSDSPFHYLGRVERANAQA
ncbi:hypothetical protein FB45DRAFT_273076 [Roridomyces roridus]|uniref:MYND-type domain-containing protein n=1 Tax=Roridomyces roridus TaxID=1738132 RepID=A0AAD7B8E1_9AGAR|nr:hypothetical protein FB45DRAFT_273076 [Roridomyces roridus]